MEVLTSSVAYPNPGPVIRCFCYPRIRESVIGFFRIPDFVWILRLSFLKAWQKKFWVKNIRNLLTTITDWITFASMFSIR